MAERRYCLSCMKEFSVAPIRLLLEGDVHICDECLSQIEYELSYEKIYGIKVLFLYKFNFFLERLLIQYKEQMDYELRSFFLYPLKLLVRQFALGKKIVPCPSSAKSIERRGFDHLAEMLSSIGLPSVSVLSKEGKSQKNRTLAKRLEKQEISLTSESSLVQGKNVILFDDVFTTGETFRQSLEVLRGSHPRRIWGLILLDNRVTSFKK